MQCGRCLSMLTVHFTSKEHVPSIQKRGLLAHAAARGTVYREDAPDCPLWEDEAPAVFLYPLFEDDLGWYNCWAMYDYAPYRDPQYGQLAWGEAMAAYLDDAKRLGPGAFSDLFVAVIVEIPRDQVIYIGAWGWPFEDDLDQETLEWSAYKQKLTMGRFDAEFQQAHELALALSGGHFAEYRYLLCAPWIIEDDECPFPPGPRRDSFVKAWQEQMPMWAKYGFEVCLRRDIPPEWIIGIHEIAHPQEPWFRADAFRRP
jgi:hypothetical protein